MTVIDTLQVLVEADARGLETTMRRVIDTATGAVNEINKQEVDWTSIFSRAVSPAIISGVASVFAMAISQSMQFQQAMATTGTAAGQSASQIGQMSQAALDMSTKVPSSAADIATTMTQVSAIFGTNTQATQDVTQALAMLSASGFGPLTEITTTAMELFREFGVTTEADAVSVLTSLMHAAEGAKETIPALGEQFSAFASQLPAVATTVGSFNGEISTFAAEVKNMGANQAGQIFDALAKAAQGAAPQMAAVGLGAQSVVSSLVNNGGLDAISRASGVLEKMGPQAALVATSLGLSAAQVEAFQRNSQHLPQIADDEKTIATSTQTIADAYGLSNSALRQLMLDWNTFKASMADIGKIFLPLGAALGSMFSNAAKDMDAFFKGLVDNISNVIIDIQKGNPGKVLADSFKGVADAIHSTVVTPAAQLGAGIANALGTVSTGALNSNLMASGLGFSQSTLQRIDQTATQNGLLSSLIGALQSGGSGDQYKSTINTFNLTLPSGPAGWTPKDLANALYAKFQGTAQ